MADSSVDMLLSDWPFGTTRCYWDTPLQLNDWVYKKDVFYSADRATRKVEKIEWDEFKRWYPIVYPDRSPKKMKAIWEANKYPGVWSEIKRVVKPNGAIVLCSAQPFTTDLIKSNRKMFRYEIIWKKTLPTGFLNARKMPMRVHENICVFYKHLPTYNPQMRIVDRNDIGRVRINGGKAQQYNEFRTEDWAYIETGKRYPVDVVEFSNWNGALFGKTDKATKHPTQKPVALFEYLIKTYTNPGDIVLDNCMGSGTTAIACLQTGRDFIGFETSSEYCDIANQRVKDHMLAHKE